MEKQGKGWRARRGSDSKGPIQAEIEVEEEKVLVLEVPLDIHIQIVWVQTRVKEEQYFINLEEFGEEMQLQDNKLGNTYSRDTKYFRTLALQYKIPVGENFV